MSIKYRITRKGKNSDLPLGVRRNGNKFDAKLVNQGVTYTFGVFDTPEDAYNAYYKKCVEIYGATEVAKYLAPPKIATTCKAAFSDERMKSVNEWKAGKRCGHSPNTLQVKPFVRDYLLYVAGYACSNCSWAGVHPADGKPLCEIDHIDGDASNSTPDNLRVLCPNCHAMTPTYKRRNPVSARKNRR